MGSPEILGIGAVAVAFGGLIWKMWADHTKLANRVTDAIEKDAVADVELSASIKSMKESSDKMQTVLDRHTQAFDKMQDRFTELIIKTFNEQKK